MNVFLWPPTVQHHLHFSPRLLKLDICLVVSTNILLGILLLEDPIYDALVFKVKCSLPSAYDNCVFIMGSDISSKLEFSELALSLPTSPPNKMLNASIAVFLSHR